MMYLRGFQIASPQIPCDADATRHPNNGNIVPKILITVRIHTEGRNGREDGRTLKVHWRHLDSHYREPLPEYLITRASRKTRVIICVSQTDGNTPNNSGDG